MDELNATVIKRIDHAPGLVTFGIRPDGGFKPFEPGQYMALGLVGQELKPTGELSPPKIIKRSYSIASAPEQSDALEFYIAILPDGALTSNMQDLKEGDRIYAAPKIVGTFTLKDVPSDHNLILVATGTGLAPFLSMVRSPKVWTEGRFITIIHGVRYEHDLAYTEELQDLAEERSNFRFFQIVSRAKPEWHGSRGYVQSFFSDTKVTTDPARDHVFLCGNPAMIDDVTKLLTGQGYIVHERKNPGSLHVEKYW
jgi:ferredoxin--NADP+ reductase